MTNTTTKYFPGLNGLRFLAAFLVMLHHVEQVKLLNGIPGLWNHPYFGSFFKNIGGLGVTFFFVLSGFLITYLLLVEQDTHKTINIPHFYFRRILRIWPLFFFVAFMSFLVLPNFEFAKPSFTMVGLTPGRTLASDQSKHTLLSSLFTPNTINAILTSPGLTFAAPLWSIVVEEVFYLIWPLLMRSFSLHQFVMMLISLFGISLIKISNSQGLSSFFSVFRFDCMCTGAIGAYLYFKNASILSFIYFRATQIINLLVLTLMLFLGVHLNYLNDAVYSILFLFLILNIATNSNTIVSLQSTILDRLGEISYGFYSFQWPLIIIIVNAFIVFGGQNRFGLSNLVIYGTSFLITTLISFLSYHLLESRFLRLKKFFS